MNISKTLLLLVTLISLILVQAASANATMVIDKTTELTSDILNSETDGILISAPDLILDCQDHIIDGTGSGYGISNPGFMNVTIKNCKIQEFETGINLSRSTENQIIGNTISKTTTGIELSELSDQNTIHGNTIDDSKTGIIIYKSFNNQATNNKLGSNVIGILIAYTSTGNILDGNELSENGLGLLIKNVFDTNLILNNVIAKSNIGIELQNSQKIQITDNSLQENQNGIRAIGSINNTLARNTLRNNVLGILLDKSHHNTIKDGTILKSLEGIFVKEGTSNTITGNLISENKIGIHLRRDSTTQVTSNQITKNSQYGIFLDDSQDPVVERNRFSGNGQDIWPLGIPGAVTCRGWDCAKQAVTTRGPTDRPIAVYFSSSKKKIERLKARVGPDDLAGIAAWYTTLDSNGKSTKAAFIKGLVTASVGGGDIVLKGLANGIEYEYIAEPRTDLDGNAITINNVAIKFECPAGLACPAELVGEILVGGNLYSINWTGHALRVRLSDGGYKWYVKQPPGYSKLYTEFLFNPDKTDFNPYLYGTNDMSTDQFVSIAFNGICESQFVDDPEVAYKRAHSQYGDPCPLEISPEEYKDRHFDELRDFVYGETIEGTALTKNYASYYNDANNFPSPTFFDYEGRVLDKKGDVAISGFNVRYLFINKGTDVQGFEGLNKDISQDRIALSGAYKGYLTSRYARELYQEGYFRLGLRGDELNNYVLRRFDELLPLMFYETQQNEVIGAYNYLERTKWPAEWVAAWLLEDSTGALAKVGSIDDAKDRIMEYRIKITAFKAIDELRQQGQSLQEIYTNSKDNAPRLEVFHDTPLELQLSVEAIMSNTELSEDEKRDLLWATFLKTAHRYHEERHYDYEMQTLISMLSLTTDKTVTDMVKNNLHEIETDDIYEGELLSSVENGDIDPQVLEAIIEARDAQESEARLLVAKEIAIAFIPQKWWEWAIIIMPVAGEVGRGAQSIKAGALAIKADRVAAGLRKIGVATLRIADTLTLGIGSLAVTGTRLAVRAGEAFFDARKFFTGTRIWTRMRGLSSAYRMLSARLASEAGFISFGGGRSAYETRELILQTIRETNALPKGELVHGTTWKNLMKIIRDGKIEPALGEYGFGVYAQRISKANDPGAALSKAVGVAQKTGDQPVLLKIEGLEAKGPDWAAIITDEVSIRNVKLWNFETKQWESFEGEYVSTITAFEKYASTQSAIIPGLSLSESAFREAYLGLPLERQKIVLSAYDHYKTFLTQDQARALALLYVKSL